MSPCGRTRLSRPGIGYRRAVTAQEDRDDEKPLAWLVMPEGAPVLDSEGAPIGAAKQALGDEGADIFHSVLVKPSGGGRLVEVPADRIEQITTDGVYTDLRPHEAASLEPYEG